MDYSAQAFGDRLRQAAARKGIHSPTALTKAIKAKHFQLALGGLKNHWYGGVIPNGMNCIAYALTLDVSLDWLLLGREAGRNLTWDDLVAHFEEIAARYGLSLEREKPEIRELVEKLRRLDQGRQKALADLLREFVDRHTEENPAQ